MPALQKKHKKSSVHNIKSVMNTRYVITQHYRFFEIAFKKSVYDSKKT